MASRNARNGFQGAYRRVNARMGGSFLAKVQVPQSPLKFEKHKLNVFHLKNYHK